MFYQCVNKKNLINFFIFFLFCNYVYSYPINLNSIPLYITQGFNISYCNLKEEDVNKLNFLRIEGNSESRKVQIPELNLNIPKRNFLEIRRLPPMDFTFLLYFTISDIEYDKIKSPAFLFAEIGESWAIYLNGKQIDNSISEIPLNQKDVVIPVAKDIINLGINTLCVHIKGDPLSKETGFYYAKPYYFDEFIYIHKYIRNYLLIFLITIYVMVGILNIIFFIKNQKEKYYLYFSIFSILLSFYIFIRSSLVNEFFFIKNAHIIFRLELISLYLTIPIFSKFLENILSENTIWYKWILYISFYSGIIFSILATFLPINALYDIILIWQLFIPFVLLGILFLIFHLTINVYKNYRKKFNIFTSFYITLLSTIPGNLLLGTILIVALSIFDIYLNIQKKVSPGLSNYGILAFLVGASFRVLYNLLNLLNQIESLNKRLKANISQLKTAYQKIQISEEKYRYLFNNTSDILFILNEKGIIENISENFNTILNLDKNNFIQKKISELIYKDDRRSIHLDFEEDKIFQLLESGKNINIQVPLKAGGDIPFKFFEIYIDTIYFESHNKQIFLRARPFKKFPLIKFLDKEYIRYIFNTDLYHIDNIIHELTEKLIEFVDDLELSMIRVGLREILINAIEHGNLNITNEEKTKYLKEGNYQEILKERLSNPLYNNKKIIVEYRFTLKEIIYKITDEGNGFDVAKYLYNENAHISDSMHGRGIFITKNAFNKVLYNKKGNVVILIKKFKQNEK